MVKEQCRFVFAAARGVHITPSRCRVKHLFLLFSARFSPEPRWPGGLFAVVPCQWRRIIGGNSEVTRINSKKEFNRSLFNQIRY
ncbi:hypothetical protein D9K77_22835 [Klebsiella pneumoniae]|nr:hypothetical protein D9K77_22835 [Klebsiella pneumoniae]